MKKLLPKLALTTMLSASFLYTSKAQISIKTTDSSYTEKMDGLANSGTSNPWSDNTTINGWYLSNSGATKITTYRASTGSDNNGAIYSFGSTGSTERALGSIESNSTGDVYYGIQLKNETGKTITKLLITYTGEQWRNGGNTSTQKLAFAYQIGATNLMSGTWTDVASLDFSSLINTSTSMELDGNNSANQKIVTDSFSITIPVNQTVFIRWKDINDLGADHGLAVDDFSVVARSGGMSDGTLTTLHETFDPCTIDMGKWQQYSVTGTQKWACTTYGRSRTNGIQMSGFSGGAVDNEDWLISPALDLSKSTYPILSFWSISAFNGLELKLKVSTNYSGTGDPTKATWTTINCILPDVASNIWTETTNINLESFKKSKVYIAFIYTSSATAGASRWTIDDINLVNSMTAPTPILSTSITTLTDLHFHEVYFPNASPAKKININALNFTDSLKISIPTPFELSKDSSIFKSTIIFSPSELADKKAIYLRFKPINKDSATYSNSLVFTYGTTKRAMGYCTASSIDPGTTLDIVTYNLEWFGHPTNGPTDNTKQLENIKTIITTLNADIYAIQEMSNDTLLAQLISKLPDYDFTISPCYSYYFDATSSDYQKIGFIYKKSTVSILKTKVLLKNLYEDVRKGTATLPGYPDDTKKFWAGGRLPFLMEAEINIKGIKRKLNFINIHARANTSGDENIKYLMRTYDAKVLKDTLDTYYKDVEFIILGDFNDRLDKTISSISYKDSPFKAYVDDSLNYSAISKKLNDLELRSYIPEPSVIDHVIISKKANTYYLQNSIRPFIPFTLIADYQSTTSDHIPITARFKLPILPTKPTAIIVPHEVYRNNLFKVRAEDNNGPSTIYQWGVFDDESGKTTHYSSSKKEIWLRATENKGTIIINVIACTASECSKPLYATILVKDNPVDKTNSISIYPNTIEKIAYITNLPEEPTTLTAEIYSLQGTKLLTQSIIDESIHVHTLSNGLYLLRIYQDKKLIHQQRIKITN